MKAIEVKNITKEFQDGEQKIEALKETNFSVDQGEFIAIIGPSGSGKSTLLTIIGGLQQPSTGQVLINGQAFSDLNSRERTKLRFNELGFILQASNLIPFLEVENQLRLVNKIKKQPFNKEWAEYLYQRLDIEKLRKKYPSDLSGGERQRVAIARALYHQPSVILADEPTASLDTERAFEVVNILSQMTREEKKATIMVTHDQRLIDQCDKVYYMEDGVLRLQTEHETMQADKSN
ncbi:ABC transporter ATP-binding protein [Facklamia sp. DSM 111018]|uniref:Putative hemin import ATP-binding protein HrtA n=1 Tax=Facklamia lactis TaxID=2749967 RepID=A0ABS0LTR3_9LACT|nr:ABC transporter ATP-binding protein [Facklamia lactis]MBG9980948.1 ABC transporter ATP-binding protein [Facklamia lactis]MBG9986689.1 ABC transporter ATP-binding protein [Facklamia lactis]